MSGAATGGHRRLAILALPALALIVVLGTLPFWVGDYWTRIWTGVAMWAGLAAAWNVIGGYAGYIDFGPVAYFGIGAYATTILMQPATHWNFFLTLPVAAVIAAAFAFVVGSPTLRLRGAYFAIATWALAEALQQIATVLGITNGPEGLSTPPNSNTSFFYYTMLIAAAVVYLVIWTLFEHSRFGYRIKAVRDHEIAAQSLGINTTAVKLEAYMLSAAIPAVFGGIDAYWITFIDPQSVLGGQITDQMVVMALVGGLGSAWGPALGAALLYLLSTWLDAALGSSTSYIAIIGVLVALIVLFLPDGIAGLVPGAHRLRLIRQMLLRAVPVRPPARRPD